MGAILDALVKKKQLDQLNDQNLAAIPQALQTFQQARERSTLIDMERRKTQATIDSLVSEANDRGRRLGIDERVANAQIADYNASARQKGALAGVLESALNDGGGAQAPGAPPVNRMIARGILSKEFGVPFDEMASPEEKQAKIAEDVQKKQAETLAQGTPTSEAGHVTLAQESIKNIDDVIKTLYPKGTPESFRRDIAFASNIPGGRAPIIGGIIPDKMPFNKDAQDVYRKMGAALSARQLIQTGVAARPEETAKLVSQFVPSVTSDPQAALNGLNELKNFYSSYINTVNTRGIASPGTASSTPGLKAAGTAAIKSYSDYLKAIGR